MLCILSPQECFFVLTQEMEQSLVSCQQIPKKAEYLTHIRLPRTTKQDDLNCIQLTVAGSGFYSIQRLAISGF